MSLVDYAASSSSDDEDDDFPRAYEGDLRPVEGDAEEQQGALPSKSPPSARKPSPPSKDGSENAVGLPSPSFEKLPDASLLLNDPTGSSSLYRGSDHASRVAAAVAERALPRKREPLLLPSANPPNKVLRATLPHKESVPDTVGGVLLPPQLRGRSNVVTEDLGKLFVKRHTRPPSG